MNSKIQKEEKKNAEELQPQKTQPLPVPPEMPKTDDSDIYEAAEVAPQFPGGMNALQQYLQANIKYPSRAVENFIKGEVVVRFDVNKDGYVSNAIIAKSLDPDCDREALRVINAMPKWSPGMIKGKPVECHFTIPVRFFLQ